MSGKPLDAGRFATSTGGIASTNISAPSTGLRDTGWPNNYAPPAGEANYLENIHYVWQKWLFDGDCQFHDLTVTGNIINNTSGVTNAAFYNALITNTLTAPVVAGSGGFVTVLDAISAVNGVTNAINKSVVVSGTGQYLHGTRTLNLGPTAFVPEGGAMTNYTWGAGGLVGTFSGNFAIANIRLDALKTVLLNGIRVYIHDAASVQMQCFLLSTTNVGVTTQIGISGGSASNNTDQTLTMANLATLLTTGKSYAIRVTTTGAASVKVYKAEIDYIE